MRRITFGQRARYWFDNTMSQGTIALIAWLAVLSVVMIVVISTIVWIVSPNSDDGQARGFGDLLWMGLMRVLDAGTMGGDAGEWPFLGSMLAVTLGGIFIVSTLIGVLTSGIEGKLDELRKGRSFVVETNHTLILGWSDQVFTIISELAHANANQRQPRIVILADKDKVEMEDEIRTKVGDTGKTRIVCRTGSPLDLSDLEIVNPHAARSIIVLSPADQDPDSQVIKAILALTNNPRRRPDPYHIVAEIRDAKNLEAARLVGGNEAEFVDVDDTISRLIAQTCRQSGLSVIYTELLDFAGDEIYVQEEPALAGKTFGDALLAYEKCVLLGLQFKDGRVVLNPPMDTRIAAGDRIIVIAEDDNTVKLSGLTDLSINTEAIRERATSTPTPEHTLMLGWNRRAPKIINELDNYVAPGSTVTVVADFPEAADAIAAQCADLRNLTVTFQRGDTTNRRTLDRLEVGRYGHIIVLCYSDILDDPQRADARTLITLLHLRDIETREGDHFSIVSEMLDDRNRALAEVTKADDFIVSDKLISLMLAQISENKHLAVVFADLFDPAGAEIYIKPAQEYVQLGQPVNFYTVGESGRRCGEVVLGYMRHADVSNAAKAYGVVLNPTKSDAVTFAEGDRIITLAQS